ncbi:hypothetical protein ACFE04_003743 [Oxalis oulophora]
MNRSSASPSSDSSNHSELYAALNCYTDYTNITLEELNFDCYCNESALIMSSELSDKPGKIVVTCKNYDQTAYGCNMWEWFDNDVLRESWIADMNERKHLRLVNNSTSNLPLSMYKGRISEGRPVCLCDKPCILLAPSIVKPVGSRFYFVCGGYYQRNEVRCCMKLLFGDTNEPNWPAILVLNLKRALDEEVEAHNGTKTAYENLEEEVTLLRMDIKETEGEDEEKIIPECNLILLLSAVCTSVSAPIGCWSRFIIVVAAGDDASWLSGDVTS